MSCRKRWLVALVMVYIISGILYATTSWENTLIGTLLALTAVSLIHLIRLSDGKSESAANAPDKAEFVATQTRLMSRLNRYQLSLSSLPEGVALIRRGQTLEWCNGAAEQHLGIRLDNDMGSPIVSVVQEKAVSEYLKEAKFDTPLQVRSMQPGRLLSLRVLLADKDHSIIVTSDITEQQRLDRVRRDFVANVSHELRTPLTVFSEAVKTLIAQPQLSEEKRLQQLHLMKYESDRMSNLVDDLLTLARLESPNSQTKDRVDTIDMAQLIEAIVKDGQKLTKKNHTFSCECDADRLLVGNCCEVRSACLNLLTNAIRYSPAGGEIALKWYYDETNHEGIFSIKDSGIGIAPIELSRLTERFYRVKQTQVQDEPGTGLGLAIVKHIAQEHGARLEIDSEVGKGSEFRLIFPSERVL